MASVWSRAVGTVRPALFDAARAALRVMTGRRAPAPRRSPNPPRSTPAYPGDFTGTPPLEYSPTDDTVADPGEVVWAFVPYEEDHSRGKDRPALVIGHDGPWLLAVPLTSKDHDRDAAQEARAGRHWVDIGSGTWDAQGRPSEARLDRIVRLDPAAIRRAGVRLDRERYEAVAAGIRTHR